MSKPTVTEFIRSLSVAELSAAFSEASGWPNEVRPELLLEQELETQRMRMHPEVQSVEPAELAGFGAGIHEAWAHHVRHEWVEQPYFSWCESVRAHLEDIGVDGIWAEWRHFRVAQSFWGTVDASVTGGPALHGVLEIKTRGLLGGGQSLGAWAQLGCYALLATESGRNPSELWAGLVTLWPVQRRAELAIWRDVPRLIHAVELLKGQVARA